MAWASVLAGGVVALVVGGLGAELFRRWALARALLDHPNLRSSHAVPTPRGGGVGIVVGFLAGLCVWVLAGGTLSPRSFGWLAGALLVATVSFVDDIRSLPALPRLAAHMGAAALLTQAGVQSRDLPLALAVPAAFFWVVLMTNVYNFMDGIDGIAGTQAIIAGLALGLGGAAVGNPLVAVSGVLLACAAGGFLLHNLPPARLFMGDVGSTFLGFGFAGLTLLGNLGVGGGELPIEVGVAIHAPFLFDGLVTLARRILRGERWFEAHRSHYYQRLVQAGLTHGRVSLLYGLLAVLAASAALFGLMVGESARLAFSALAFAPMLGIVGLAWRLERRVGRTVTP